MAHGREPLRRLSIAKSIGAFANSRDGGYVILGAAHDKTRTWSLPGLADRGTEPAVWLESVIVGAVLPRPRHQVRTLRLTDERFAGLIRVWPVPTPPALVGGVAYMRVSGMSIPITDPVELGRLYRQGETARSAAESRAAGAIQWPTSRNPPGDRLHLLYAVSLSPVAPPPDVSSRLFRRSYIDELHSLLRSYLTPPVVGPVRAPEREEWAQSFVEVGLADPFGDAASALTVRWDGSAVVSYWAEDTPARGIDHLREPGNLARPWRLGVDALALLGGTGATYVTVFAVHDPGGTYASRWTEELGHPSDETLASVIRELRRSRGRADFEPEGDD